MNLVRLCVLCFFWAEVSMAGAVLTSMNGLYLSKKIENNDNSSTESTQSYLSLELNYLSSSRFILGALYLNDTLDSGSNIEKTNGYGPQLGYLFSSWGLTAAYLTQMEYVPNSSSSMKWKEGVGYQLCLEYLALGQQGVFWGFQWVYRVVEYKKYFDGSNTVDNQRKVSETFPQIKVGYAF